MQIKAEISEDKAKIVFHMEDSAVFKHPRMQIKMTRWQSSIEGNTLIIPVNEANLEEIFRQATSLFESMGNQVKIEDEKVLIGIKTGEAKFLESCKKARENNHAKSV